MQERGLILNVQVQNNNSEKIEQGKDLVKKKKKKNPSQRKRAALERKKKEKDLIKERGIIMNVQGPNKNSEKIKQEKYVVKKKKNKNQRQGKKAEVEREKKGENMSRSSYLLFMFMKDNHNLIQWIKQNRTNQNRTEVVQLMMNMLTKQMAKK